MDFVIVGIVIGAVLVGVGALLRDLGPRFRPRPVRADSAKLEPETLELAWTRFCQSIGMAVTTLGFLLVVTTVVAFIGNVSDGAGWSIVGAASIVAIAGSVASTVLISRHYQRGGFDPRIRSEEQEAAPISLATEPASVLLADRIVSLEPGDPFEFPEPIPAPASRSELAEHMADPDVAPETASNAEPSDYEPVQPVPLDLGSLELNALVEVAPNPDEIVDSDESGVEAPAEALAEAVVLVPEERRSPSIAAPVVSPEARAEVESTQPSSPRVEPSTPPVRPSRERSVVAPPSPMPVLSSIDPPLIDPDDELPAWNAPPVPHRPAATRYTPMSEVGGSFESSLFADLRSESSLENDSGPFQSRLLNELTASDDDPDPAGHDVLIAESPAVDSNRGARPE